MLKISEKIFNLYVLAAVNLAIILAAEFVGGGRYFSESGLIHLLAAIFVLLVGARVFSGHAFADKILKSFLTIQLYSLLFLTTVHIFEYITHKIVYHSVELVELSVVVGYLVWILANILGCEYILKAYRRRSGILFYLLIVVIGVISFGLVVVNILGRRITEIGWWVPATLLILTVVLGVIAICRFRRVKVIMPVFRNFVNYSIPATILVVFSAFFETSNILARLGVSSVQADYLVHFVIYAALSILIIGFGKLLRPQGVYEELQSESGK